MAHRRHAFLWILVFLVSVSPNLACPSRKSCIYASGHNEIEFLNEKNNMSFQSTVTLENRTTFTDPPGTTLIYLRNGTSWDYAISKDTLNVLTSFTMVNASGQYYQDVFTWSNVRTPYVPCSTNCSWRIDEQGFSVAEVAHGGLKALQFIVSWNGPYPPS